MSRIYRNSKRKLVNIARTIDGLLDGDMPMQSGKSALAQLKANLSELEKELSAAYRLSDSESVVQAAQNTNLKMLRLLPVLGFILRSTNVRNAFEVLQPLQKLADAAIPTKPQLILSSEWDYVPFAYKQTFSELSGFVLIGLPASEAASALLLPLAGHEMGHAVWGLRKISALANIQIKCDELYVANDADYRRIFSYREGDMVSEDEKLDSIARSVELAAFRAEEIFCDLFGYATFGMSYSLAFAYLLAPGSGRPRTSQHPGYSMRLGALSAIAKKEGVELPTANDLGFVDEPSVADPKRRFIERMANLSVDHVVPGLWNVVLRIIQEGNIRRPSSDAALSHSKDFKSGIPARDPKCLGDIVNAGWKILLEEERKSRPPAKAAKHDSLNEIMLKSVEVLEFQTRLG
jgi:hypothetical protein